MRGHRGCRAAEVAGRSLPMPGPPSPLLPPSPLRAVTVTDLDLNESPLVAAQFARSSSGPAGRAPFFGPAVSPPTGGADASSSPSADSDSDPSASVLSESATDPAAPPPADSAALLEAGEFDQQSPSEGGSTVTSAPAPPHRPRPPLGRRRLGSGGGRSPRGRCQTAHGGGQAPQGRGGHGPLAGHARSRGFGCQCPLAAARPPLMTRSRSPLMQGMAESPADVAAAAEARARRNEIGRAHV